MARTKTSRREQQPDGDFTRTLIRTLCGWCATNEHEDCKRELLWYEKHYVCKCSCADEFYTNLTSSESSAILQAQDDKDGEDNEALDTTSSEDVGE